MCADSNTALHMHAIMGFTVLQIFTEEHGHLHGEIVAYCILIFIKRSIIRKMNLKRSMNFSKNMGFQSLRIFMQRLMIWMPVITKALFRIDVLVRSMK